MPENTDSISLGATLYLPATRADLADIASGRRHPDLRSAVVCLEDSVRPNEVAESLANVARLLRGLDPDQARRPRLFVRPRDHDMLSALLALPGIERVSGFVVPKATADSLPPYLRRLAGEPFLLMPTLETREVFDSSEMRRLRDQLLAVQEQVIVIRIGGNDLLQTIGARRSALRTVYEGPLASTIVALIATFAPYGFSLSAPVFEHFADQQLLREEVERDIEHGLLTKTAIHPAQIAAIQGIYKVTPSELAEAREILAVESPAVFAAGGSMCEPATHRRWARSIVKRAETFGTTRDGGAMVAL